MYMWSAWGIWRFDLISRLQYAFLYILLLENYRYVATINNLLYIDKNQMDFQKMKNAYHN